MGIETAIIVGLTAASAISGISAAKKEAKASIAEGNIALSNKAKEIKYKTGSLTSSFLNSGLTLEGTPMNVIEQAYNTGLEDLGAISSKYNTNSKNIMAKARTQAIMGLAKAGVGFASGGGFDGMFDSTHAAINSVPTNFASPYFGAAGEETFNPQGTNWFNYLEA